jgi:MFS family permease
MCICSIIMLMPSSIIDKLYSTCDKNNTILNYYCKGNTMVCSTWLTAVFVFFGMLLYSTGAFFDMYTHKRVLYISSILLKSLGIFFILICALIHLSIVPTHVHNRFIMVIVLCVFVSIINVTWTKWKKRNKDKKMKITSTQSLFNAQMEMDIQDEFKNLMTTFF